MRLTFRHGIHPPSNKDLTRNLPLVEFQTPEKVYISMLQHIGAAAIPTVSIGSEVKAGTLIGRANGFISANIYSSVSGKVTAFKKLLTPQGTSAIHIEITNDFNYEEEFLPPLKDMSNEAILERIQLAGIVGMGGATFPTHIKLKPSKPIDTLIINGAECEPYITCDFRLMLEKTNEIIEGIKIIMKLLGVETSYIGIENNKPEAIEILKAESPGKIKVCSLTTKYPQGAEKQLIHAITKRNVIVGGLPMDVGCVVDNIHTALSIYEAVVLNRPSYKRAFTVSGKGIEKPANIYVRTGVQFQDIYNFFNENKEKSYAKIISGGPMMGFAQPDLNATVSKGSSALLFLKDNEINKREISECINCARCHRVCPMKLMPMMFDRNILKNDTDMLKKYNITSCVECGSCTYVCPAARHIIQSIRLGKKSLKNAK